MLGQGFSESFSKRFPLSQSIGIIRAYIFKDEAHIKIRRTSFKRAYKIFTIRMGTENADLDIRGALSDSFFNGISNFYDIRIQRKNL